MAESETAVRADGGGVPPTLIALRPIGNPLTMGLVGLAVVSVVMSGHEFRWYGGERLQVGLIIAIAGPLLQTIAAVVAFQARDSVAATAMGIQAGTWLYTGVTIASTPPGSYSVVLGTALLMSGLAVTLTGVNAARFRGLFAIVVGLTGLRWLLSGIAQTSAAETWGLVAGVVGLVVAALAVLAASVGETEEERGRPLPIALRRGRGERVFSPDRQEHARKAAIDAGARDLL